MTSEDLQHLAAAYESVTFTTGRLLIMAAGKSVPDTLITAPHDARLHIAACPGQPHCASASVDTHALAKSLAALYGRCRADRTGKNPAYIRVQQGMRGPKCQRYLYHRE